MVAPDRAQRGVEPATGRAPKDILAGLVFVGLGLAFAVIGTGYRIGSTVEMGPGYFPVALGILLVVLGGVIAARGFLNGEGDAVGAIPWRALGLILAPIVVFGLTVRGLGLIPAIFVTGLLAAFASRRTGPVAALLIAVGLTILSVLIFVAALRLQLPLTGPWLRV